MKWYDEHLLIDTELGHKWIIRSNRLITNNQYFPWVAEALREWRQLLKEKD